VTAVPKAVGINPSRMSTVMPPCFVVSKFVLMTRSKVLKQVLVFFFLIKLCEIFMNNILNP
ncbi:hypothetical protein, partial [Bacillus thuringiensis]